jgi:ribonuclease HI
MWSKDVTLDIISHNERYIDCYIDSSPNITGWRATGLYGYSSHHQKHQTCNLINSLYQNNSLDKWLLFGDFNMVLNHAEKQGGRDINLSQSNLFHDTLNNCNLQDLGFHGDMFTWANNQEKDHHIKERLDRFCASSSWLNQFPRVTNYHLPHYSSDHIPILLVFGNNHDFRNDSRGSTTIRRFEHIWIQDPQSSNIIKESWVNSSEDTYSKLNNTFNKVYQWGQTTYGNIPRQIKEPQIKIQNLKAKIPTKEEIEQTKQLERRLDNLLQHEETWWAQRAKANWLQNGDKNSTYFHQKASQRNRKNKINFINSQDGNRMTDNLGIQNAFMDYFIDIFSTSNPSNMAEALAGVANRIQPHLQDHLNQNFTAEEVAQAVHQLNSNSAPGPDGLSAKFFQTYWETIGGDITKLTLDILNNSGSPEPLNKTYICLIPKNNHPSTPADFRPIALCNVILKIVTKTLANRIKPILNDIISPQQSAFLPGRLITDNTLIAYETFHYLKHTKARKHGYVGIKLDMAKAYDRIEWPFLEKTLITMGFPSRLVNTIMACVSTVSFSILINGKPSPEFRPHRGIRQGDPLSPYLFIICAEVLSSLISQLQITNKIKGITIATNAPHITHLFFADDSLLFCRAKATEAIHLMTALNEYQRISGQQINLNKSEMTFSPLLHQNIQQEFHNIIPIQVTDSINKYLGMPTTLTRTKTQDFNCIMDRIMGKLKGWKEKKLSFAGRNVLVSAVIQAIPTYMMSCFILPKAICHRIEQAMCNFWWGSKEGHHKIHWKAKRDLFRPKFNGGIGFRDMHIFNLAMLAKQGWRLHTNPSSLLSQCLKAKYYPHCDILQAQLGNMPSYTWRSIQQGLWVLNKGCCWNIGSGNKVNIWKDNWIPQQNGFKTLTTQSNHSQNLVSDLITNHPLTSWNTSLINSIFLPFERELIQQIPLTQEPNEDQIMWPHTNNGIYTVKSGYNVLKQWQENSNCGSTNSNPHNLIWKRVWTLPTVPRHKALLWRIINKALPVRSALNHKGIQCPIWCPRCLQGEETINHLFMSCSRAHRVWFGSSLGIRFNTSHTSFTDWLIYCISTLKEEDLCTIASITYGIWFARNKMVFDNYDIEEKDIINKATSAIRDYQLANIIDNRSTNKVSYRHNSNNSNARSTTQNQQRDNQHAGWKKPRRGNIKANCDANLKVNGKWGLGAIFRDNEGQILASATWEVPDFNDPATAEAYALYLSMRLAVECCFTRVEFETDSSRVIDGVNGNGASPRNYLGNLIAGILHTKSHFAFSSFSHIPRKANNVAHELASLAHFAFDCIWLEEAHPTIVPFVLMDLN